MRLVWCFKRDGCGGGVGGLGGGGKMADGKSFVEVEVGEDNRWKQESETTLDLQLFFKSARQQAGWWLDGCGSSKATPDATIHPVRFCTSLQKQMW